MPAKLAMFCLPLVAILSVRLQLTVGQTGSSQMVSVAEPRSSPVSLQGPLLKAPGLLQAGSQESPPFKSFSVPL